MIFCSKDQGLLAGMPQKSKNKIMYIIGSEPHSALQKLKEFTGNVEVSVKDASVSSEDPVQSPEDPAESPEMCFLVQLIEYVKELRIMTDIEVEMMCHLDLVFTRLLKWETSRVTEEEKYTDYYRGILHKIDFYFLRHYTGIQFL